MSNILKLFSNTIPLFFLIYTYRGNRQAQQASASTSSFWLHYRQVPRAHPLVTLAYDTSLCQVALTDSHGLEIRATGTVEVRVYPDHNEFSINLDSETVTPVFLDRFSVANLR